MPVRRNRLRSIICASAVLAAGCDGSPTDPGPLVCTSAHPAIAIGGSVSGSLETTDTQLADDTFYDAYSLTVQDTEDLTILMTSTEIDAFLYLLDEAERPIELDHDDAGGTDAMIERSLDRGCYVIYANSWEPETGGYALSVAITPPEE